VPENVRTNFAVPTLVKAGDLLAIQDRLVKQQERRTVSRAHYFKRLILSRPVHNGEACSVNDGKCLMGKAGPIAQADCKSQLHDFYTNTALLKLLPKAVGYLRPISTVEQ